MEREREKGKRYHNITDTTYFFAFAYHFYHSTAGQKHTFAVHFESNNIYINIITFLFLFEMLAVITQWKPKWLADWLDGLSVLLHFEVYCCNTFDIRFSAIMQMNINKLWKQTVCFARIFHHSLRQMKRMNQIKTDEPADRAEPNWSKESFRWQYVYSTTKWAYHFKFKKSILQCRRVNEFEYDKKSVPKNGCRISIQIKWHSAMHI